MNAAGGTDQLVFTLTLQDYVSANRLHLRASYKRFRTYRLWLWVILLYWVFMVAVDQSFRPSKIVADGVTAIALGIVVIVVCGLLTLLMIPLRAKRLFAQQKTLHQEQRVSIGAETIAFDGATFHLTHAWSDFPRWNESTSFILLYITDNAFHILPARALTEDIRARIRHALQQAGVRKDR